MNNSRKGFKIYMKKGLKIALGIVGGIATVWALIALLPRPNNYKLENTMLK